MSFTAMADAERIFLDTNVLLSVTDQSREHHQASIHFLDDCRSQGVRLFLSGQVMREYLVVATRPVESNGLGLAPAKASHNLETFMEVARLLPENGETAKQLRTLVSTHALVGKRIHDAGIVATMRSHGLSHLKTWNPDDFARFPGLHLI
jgi:predicted nucleic acid-binding protein